MRDQCDLRAQVMLAEFAHIDAIDGDGAFDCVVETWDEIGEGGFTGTAWADQCNRLTLLDLDVDVVEGDFVFVGEGNVVEADFSANEIQRLRIFRFWNGIFGM